MIIAVCIRITRKDSAFPASAEQRNRTHNQNSARPYPGSVARSYSHVKLLRFHFEPSYFLQRGDDCVDAHSTESLSEAAPAPSLPVLFQNRDRLRSSSTRGQRDGRAQNQRAAQPGVGPKLLAKQLHAKNGAEGRLNI